MWEISYNSIERYFKLLQETGYIPYDEVYDLLSLIAIEELINDSFQDLVSEEDSQVIQTYISSLFNKNCLIGCFPNNIDMEYWSNAGSSTDVETKINALTTEVSELQENVSTLQTTVAKQTSDIKTCTTATAANTTTINKQASAISSLQTSVKNDETKISNLEASDTSIKSTLNTHTTNINNLNNSVNAASIAASQVANPRVLGLGFISALSPSIQTSSIDGGGKALGSYPNYSTSLRRFYITKDAKTYISWGNFSDISNSEAYTSGENLYFDGTTLYKKSGNDLVEIGGGESSDVSERLAALENNLSALAAVKVLKTKS